MQSRPTAELAILLVDDERQTLKYFERAFAKDFNVLTAPSACFTFSPRRAAVARTCEFFNTARNDSRVCC